MSSKQQFISGLSWNTATVVFQVIIQTVYTAILARMVAPEAFAIMGIVLSLVGFAEIFSQVGIGPALIQKKEIHPQHLTGAFYTSLILGILFTSAFVIAAPSIASWYNTPLLSPIISVTSLSFTLSALGVVPRNIILKKMKFREFFYCGMISIIGGNLVVGLILAYYGFGVWAYVWALFAQNALMTMSYWWFERISFPLFWKWSFTKDLISYGASSTLFNALNYAATKVDVTLLPKWSSTLPADNLASGMEKAGWYERSAYVMSLPITIMAKLSDNVLFSGMSKMQDETARLQRLILLSSHVLSIVIIPSTVFISVFALPIITIYLGQKYSSAAPVLAVLFFAIIFRSLSRLTDALLRAKNAVWKGVGYKLIYLFIMIIGVLASVRYGLIIVAASIVFTTAIHYIMSVAMCNSLIQLNQFRLYSATRSGWILGALSFTVLCPFLFENVMHSLPPLSILLIGAVVWISAMLAAVYIFPSLLRYENISLIDLLPLRIRQSAMFQKFNSNSKED